MRMFAVRMPGMSIADGDEQVFGSVEGLTPYRRAKGDRNLVASLLVTRRALGMLRRPDLAPLDQARRDAAGLAGHDARPRPRLRPPSYRLGPHVPAAPWRQHEAPPRVRHAGRRPSIDPGPHPRPPSGVRRPGQPHRGRHRRHRLGPARPPAVAAGSAGGRRSRAHRDVRCRPRRHRGAHRGHGAPAGRRGLPPRSRASRQRRVRAGQPRLGDGCDAGLRHHRPAAERPRGARPRRGCRRPPRRRRPSVGRGAAGGPEAHPWLGASGRRGRPAGIGRSRASQGHPRAGEPRRPPCPP